MKRIQPGAVLATYDKIEDLVFFAVSKKPIIEFNGMNLAIKRIEVVNVFCSQDKQSLGGRFLEIDLMDEYSNEVFFCKVANIDGKYKLAVQGLGVGLLRYNNEVEQEVIVLNSLENAEFKKEGYL